MAKVKNKRNSGLADKVNSKKKAVVMKKKLNPFEVHINREKLKVLGQKSKHDRGLPGVSRSKAIQKRKETLGTEMKLMNKTNTFIDRRIGEKDNKLSSEERIVARFAAERAKQHSKKNIYNLADEEVLTHRGQTLEQIEKFDDPRSSDDEEEGGKRFGGLDDEFVSEGHFGGGVLTKTTSKDGAKSHKDLIDQLIAESKKRKAEKQKEKEQTLDLTEKLDSEWKDLQPVVLKKARVEEVSLIDKLLDGAEKNSQDYDKMMRELRFEKRGTPSNALVSDEQKTEEEKKKLDQLERERNQRMLGEEEGENAPRPTYGNHRSAEDLDDNFDLEPEGHDYMLAYDKDGNPLVPEHVLKDKYVPGSKKNFNDGISDSSDAESDDNGDEESTGDDDNDDKSDKEETSKKGSENTDPVAKDSDAVQKKESVSDESSNETSDDSKSLSDKLDTGPKMHSSKILNSKKKKEDMNNKSDENDVKNPNDKISEKDRLDKKSNAKNADVITEDETVTVRDKTNGTVTSESSNGENDLDLKQNDSEESQDDSDVEQGDSETETKKKSVNFDNFDDLRSSDDSSDDEDDGQKSENENDVEKKDNDVDESNRFISFFDKNEEASNLKNLLSGKTPSQQSIAIEKLIKTYDPSLGQNNKENLSRLFAHLLQYINDTFTNLTQGGDIIKSFLIFDKLCPHLYDLAQTNKVSTKKFLAEVLKEKHDDFKKNSKRVPDLDTLVFFKLVSLIYPTSDFRHPVATPSIAFMSEILTICKFRDAYSISRGIFIVALLLEYTILSKRFIPPAINFLRGFLYLCSNTSILNPIQIVPPFRLHRDVKILKLEEDCTKMAVEKKMAARDLVLKEIDNDFKIRSLNTCVLMLKEFFDNYSDLDAQEFIFDSHISLLSRIDVDLYPKKCADVINKTLGYMKQCIEVKIYTPLAPEKVKPKFLRLYEPDIQDVFTGTKSNKQSREQTERDKMKNKYKRAMKGALREIRRDKSYIGSVKIRQKIQSDNIRKEKVKQIYKDASMQQGELNKLKRMK